MGMDRPGIETCPSRMLSGFDATTPTAPELRRPRVLIYVLGTAFSAEALSRPVRLVFFLSAAGALLWLALAVGKRVRPGKALKHLQGTVFSAEALSRPARPAFSLPFCCRRTPLVGARCGQTSAGPPVRLLFFLSAAGALLWFLSFSFLLPARSFGWCSLWTNECGLEKRGKRSFCGWPLPLDR